MNRLSVLFLVILLSYISLFSFPLQANQQGMLSFKSDYNQSETVNRLEQILTKNITKHSITLLMQNLQKKPNINLPETELIIFGNPKIGSK
jgi:uncharacterized protein (DUF302 family)